MELSVEERYVSCALYTLALHSTVRDAMTAEPFAESIDGRSAAMGYLERDDSYGVHTKVSDEEEARIVDRVTKGKPMPTIFEEAQALELRVLCERLYARMLLPRKAWAGLQAMPRQALDSREDSEVLQSYVQSLVQTLEEGELEERNQQLSREEGPVPQAIGIIWALLDASIGIDESDATTSAEPSHGTNKMETAVPGSPSIGKLSSGIEGIQLQSEDNSQQVAGTTAPIAQEETLTFNSSHETASPVLRKDTVYQDAVEFTSNRVASCMDSSCGSHNGSNKTEAEQCSKEGFDTGYGTGVTKIDESIEVHIGSLGGHAVELDEDRCFDQLLLERANAALDTESGGKMEEECSNMPFTGEGKFEDAFALEDIEFEAFAEDESECEDASEENVPGNRGITAEEECEKVGKHRASFSSDHFEVSTSPESYNDSSEMLDYHQCQEAVEFEATFSDAEDHEPVTLEIPRRDSPQKRSAPSLMESSLHNSAVFLQSPSKIVRAEPADESQQGEKVVVLQDNSFIHWYDARSRTALHRLAIWLRLPWDHVAPLESLLATQRAQPVIAVDLQEAHKDGKASKYRWLKVGAAATLGGALLALTGGLAAPALAAGVGTAMAAAGAGASAAMASAMLTTPVVAAGFGAAGAGIMGKKFDRLTAGIKELAFVSLGQAQAEDAEGDARLAASREDQEGNQQLFDAQEEVDLIDWGGESDQECLEEATDEAEANAASAAAYAALKAKEQTAPASLMDELTALSDEETEAEVRKKCSCDDKETKVSRSNKESEEEPSTSHPRHASLVSDDKEHLAVTLAISGWVRDMEDYSRPWYGLSRVDCERFCLEWESAELLALGKALESFVRSRVAQEGAKYWIAHTAAAGVLAACAWPSLILTASNFIDNAWAVAMDRAEKLGHVLADILVANFHGDKPITLVGYSLGAKAIFHCLEELQKKGRRGIVERAILLGAPVEGNAKRWRNVREVVAGRLVNGYTMNDWALGLVFRATNSHMAAGLSPVAVNGVENVNLSSLIDGHSDYADKIGSILHLLSLA